MMPLVCRGLIWFRKMIHTAFRLSSLTRVILERKFSGRRRLEWQREAGTDVAVVSRQIQKGKRADNLDTILFRLAVLALPFSPSSSGRHFAGFPVAIKTHIICVNCALINEIMTFGMISELVSTRFFYGQNIRTWIH